MFVPLLLLSAIAVSDTVPAAPTAARGTVTSAASPSSSRALLADSIVVDKSDRELTLFYHGAKVKTYAVALGRNPFGAKQRRGDGKTPEGLYYIEGRNPQSKYHLALRVSYPTPQQRTLASRMGVSPGGDIMIHGLPDAFASVGALHRQQDWTEGCVAVTNQEIEEIWRAVPNGAPILIRP